MTFGNGGEDFTECAWISSRVGIWYGSWLPNDLYDAYGNERPVVTGEVVQRLNETTAVTLSVSSNQQLPEFTMPSIKNDLPFIAYLSPGICE
jgi:hypothetical protein